MRSIIVAIALAAAASVASAQPTTSMPTPTEAKKAQTPQQQRMTKCNKEATGKKGDERKAFMKECLAKKD